MRGTVRDTMRDTVGVLSALTTGTGVIRALVFQGLCRGSGSVMGLLGPRDGCIG